MKSVGSLGRCPEHHGGEANQLGDPARQAWPDMADVPSTQALHLQAEPVATCCGQVAACWNMFKHVQTTPPGRKFMASLYPIFAGGLTNRDKSPIPRVKACEASPQIHSSSTQLSDKKLYITYLYNFMQIYVYHFRVHYIISNYIMLYFIVSYL